MGRGANGELPGVAPGKLRITPPAVLMSPVLPGETHSRTVTVKNVHSHVQTIKVSKPKCPEFQLSGVNAPLKEPCLTDTVQLAPGLEVSYKITFVGKELQDVHDVLVVQTQEGTVHVPLRALKPAPLLVASPALPMGLVVVEQSSSHTFAIRNEGHAPGAFHIDFDTSTPLKISPVEAEVAAGETMDVQVTIQPVDLGHLSTTLEVITDKDKPPQLVDVTATVMSSSVEILSAAGAPVKKIGFGTQFCGTTMTMDITVLNNSPNASAYAMKVGPRKEIEGLIAEDLISITDWEGFPGLVLPPQASGQPIIAATPLTKKLEAYEKQVVSFTFASPQLAPTKGFRAGEHAPEDMAFDHSYVLLLLTPGAEDIIKIPITARSSLSAVSLSPDVIDFGDVAANGSADILITARNASPELPAKFKVPYSHLFAFEPTEGFLQPGGQASLVATYRPRALGNNRDVVKVEVTDASGQGIQTVVVDLAGTCGSIGPKAAPRGGLGTVPSDFARERSFVTMPGAVGEEGEDGGFGARPTARSARSNFTYTRPFEAEEYAGQFVKRSDQSGMALTRAETAHKAAHRDNYTTYLRESQATRGAKALAEATKHVPRNEWNEDAVNIGMGSASGLLAPDYPLPPPVEALWMDTVTRKEPQDGTYVRPRNRPAFADEEAQLLKAKFRTKPTTAEEKKQCGATLMAYDIAKLQAGPRVLDFGEVSAMSTNVKMFAVTNNLRHAVLVALDIPPENEEFEGSDPMSQVIPPGMTAGFGISLCVPKVGAVTRTVEYTINGVHRYSFFVEAHVVPVSLQLSREDILFQFSPDNWESTVVETVMITNQNNHAAEYTWEVSSPAYDVTPMKGMVHKKSAVEATIKWHPSAQGNDCQLLLKIAGGVNSKVRCRGEIPEGKCMFREKALDFGNIPVGIQLQQTVTLRNLGMSDSVYQVEPQASSLLQVEPVRGRIQHSSVQDLEVAIRVTEPGPHREVLNVNVRGGRALKLPITAEAVVPEVQDEVEFGSVYIGGSAKQLVTLTNTSVISATLHANFRDKPEFTVHMPRDLLNAVSDKYEEPPVVKVAGPATPVSSYLQRRGTSSVGDAMSREPTPRNQPGGEDGDGDDFADNPIGCEYRILVAPQSSISFYLVFRPQTVAAHGFELPLSISGVPSTEGLCKAVGAEGLHPRVLLSQSVVDFGSMIVLRKERAKIPYARMLDVVNNTQEELAWGFGAPADESGQPMSSVYAVEPPSGTIPPGASTQVKVTFLPRHSQAYFCALPLYLDGNEEKAYVELTVRGTGRWPKLKFETREILLPTVPLGMASTTTFMVVNDGYDNLEVKYRLPPDEQRLPLQLDFPEGMLLGIAKDKLPVVVSFVSNKPMSFTANIDFLDDDGNRFSVPVTGVADNSVLSLYNFMSANVEDLETSAPENGPVALVDKQYNLPMLPPAESAASAVSPALIKWLNASTIKGPFGDFTSDMVASKGRTMIELVELLAGKTVQGKVTKLSANRKDHAEQLLGQYEKLLSFLKSHGALLNHVKPELLLEHDDFKRVLTAREISMQDQPDGDEILSHWHKMDPDFAHISSEAWHAVAFQVIKVFVLARVTPKSFRALPGIADTSDVKCPDAVFSSSNVYSVPEAVLLRWATVHWQRGLPTIAERVTNFDRDFQSGFVLYSLFVNHWPSLKIHWRSMAKPCETAEDVANNAGVVVQMLQDLHLTYPITVKELTDPQPREMTIFLMYLYQALPQLLPRAQIDFEGKLGENLVKTLELTNPSNKVIVYHARLEGHSDFTIDQTMVRLEPKSKIQFPVDCVPTISKPVESRIVLSSRREGTAHAATMVFALRSLVQARAPLRTVHLKAPLYELVEGVVEVENPFPIDADMTITLEQTVGNPSLPFQPKKAGEGDGKKKKPSAPGMGRRKNGDEKPPTPKIEELEPENRTFPDPFGCDRKTVRIKRGETGRIQIAFLPFYLGTHRLLILLEDKEFGQFAVEVVGEALLPAPQAPIKQTVECAGVKGEVVVRDVYVPFGNVALEAAKRTFIEKHPLAKVREMAELAKAATSQGDSTFVVMHESPHMSLPSALTCKFGVSPPKRDEDGNLLPQQENSKDRLGLGKGEAAGGAADAATPERTNNLQVSLQPVGPGLYPAKVVLCSLTDVRVVDMEFTASSASHAASLSFECSARQSIRQEIPMVNTSDKTLTISAQISGQHFSGPRDVTVPPESTVNYSLVFRPPWIGTYNGELKMDINATGESSVYTLVGTGVEPLAEKHLLIQCNARTPVTKKLHVPNVSNDNVTYKVYSDLACITGQDSVKIKGPAGTVDVYDLHVIPPFSGTIRGSITFQAESGHYVWYTVELVVAPPPSVGTLKARAEIRKAQKHTISITNPLKERLTLDVVMKGHGLLGKKSIVLEPEASGEYELYYSPLRAGSEGGSVHFVSPEVGEFWYDVELEATSPPPLEVPIMVCEVGTRKMSAMTIQNPLSEEVVLTSTSTNPRNFTVSPSSIALPPFGRSEVSVEYIPSALNEVETGLVTFKGPAGEWTFAVSGRGSAPTEMDQTFIASTIGQSSSSFVSFRNPFPSPGVVSVSVEAEEPVVFSIIMKRTKQISVPAFGTIQIPVSFTPLGMSEGMADVVVDMEAPVALSWRFPLVGVAEAVPTGVSFRYEVPARKVLREVLSVKLEGMGPLNGEEEFTHEVSVPEAARTAVRRALTISPLSTAITSPEQPLTFEVVFEPMRVFSTSIDFIITKASGGRWRFEVQLEASEPDIDDTLVVESRVGAHGELLKAMNSGTETDANFTAFFTADSPTEFSVSPRKGTLPSLDSGLSHDLVVAFAPVEYGKEVFGKLVVRTDEMQWTFGVRGTHPRYAPPVVGPKVQTRLESDARPASPPKRNFLRENLGRSGVYGMQ